MRGKEHKEKHDALVQCLVFWGLPNTQYFLFFQLNITAKPVVDYNHASPDWNLQLQLLCHM